MVVNCPTNSLKKKNTTFTEAESVCDVVRQLQCSTSQGKKEVETGKTHKSRELTHKEKHLCRGCVGDITERQNSGHKQKKKKKSDRFAMLQFLLRFLCACVCVCVCPVWSQKTIIIIITTDMGRCSASDGLLLTSQIANCV